MAVFFWCGDADDAINTDALREHGIKAILNMALGDCKREAELSRPLGAMTGLAQPLFLKG